MNKRAIMRNTAVAIATMGVGIAIPVGAMADSSPTPVRVTAASPSAHTGDDLATLKTKCDQAVQRREGTLGADLSFINQSASLSSSDQATLKSQVTADQTGLTALDATIQADTTWQQAHTDCETIVTGFRVYVMEDPKIHEVMAADAVSKVNALFMQLEPTLQADINASQSPNKAAAQTALNDLESKVRASQTSISGVSASIINLAPSGYPGNAVTLKSAQANIQTSHSDLEGARGDVNTILKDLK